MNAVHPSMLVGLTSLAMAFLAIHTKWIYTNAMKDMISEQLLPARPTRR